MRAPDARHCLPAWAQAAALALCTVLAYLPGIGRQEFVGTEDFRARIAAETVESGHWLLPSYYGRPILTKPPLHYWALGGVLHLTGDVAPWSARLLSLAALAATVVLIGLCARRAGGVRAGWLAGLGYLIGANTLKNGVNAEIDPFLALWIVAALLAWWRALEGERRPSLAWGALAGLCAGLAFLTKSFALLPFLLGAALATLRMERRPVLPAVAAAALPFLPLALLWPLHLRNLDPQLHAAAITEGSELFWNWTSQSLARTLLYPVALAGACLPFTLAAFPQLRAPGRASLDRYLAWVVAGAFALLMLSAGKSTRYLLPCFPLLVTAGVLRLELLGRAEDFLRWVCGLFLLLAAAAVPFLLPVLTPSGTLALATFALASLAGFLVARERAVLALALLPIPARALFTQVYVPSWERTHAIAPSVDFLRARLAGLDRLGVARWETPRLLDPLHKSVHYYDRRKDLAEALRQGAHYDALLVGEEEVEAALPGYRRAVLLHVNDTSLTLYLPDSD